MNLTPVIVALCIGALAALLIVIWALFWRCKVFRRCWVSEKTPEIKLEDPVVNIDSLAAVSMPPPTTPALQSWVKAAQNMPVPAVTLVQDGERPTQSPLSLTEMVTMQGGQVSNNALWDEQHPGLAPAVGQPLSVSSVLTTRKQQPESDDSQGTQKGMLFSASTAMQTLPFDSTASQQQCACLKGRPRRALNWSLAVRVCETTDVTCLPLASPPQQQVTSRGALGTDIDRSLHVFQLQGGHDKMDGQTPLIQGAAAFVCSLSHLHVLPVLSHLCKPAALCAEDCKCCLEVLLESEQSNGGALADAIQRGLFCRSVVREQWAIATSVLCDVAHGMQFLHSQGVCHGSLNPDNIQLQMDEESHFSIGAAVAAGAACARVANMFTCPAVPEPGDVSTPESHDFQNSVFVAPEMQEAMRCTKANDIYAFGVLMLGPSSNPEQAAFPVLPEAAPLTYTLLLKACLSTAPKDRPSFKHMEQIFADMRKEMLHDHYVDSTGSVQMASRLLRPVSGLRPKDGKSEAPSPALLYGNEPDPAPPSAESSRMTGGSSPSVPSPLKNSFSQSQASGSPALANLYGRTLPDLSRLMPALYNASDQESSCSVSGQGFSKTASFMLDLTMADLERRSSRDASSAGTQSGSPSPNHVSLSPWNNHGAYDSCESASELLFPLKAAFVDVAARELTGRKNLNHNLEQKSNREPGLKDHNEREEMVTIGEETATRADGCSLMATLAVQSDLSGAPSPSISVSGITAQVLNNGETAPAASRISPKVRASNHWGPPAKPVGSNLPRRPNGVTGSHSRDMGPSSREKGPSRRDLGPSSRDWGPSSRDMGPSSREKGPSRRDSGPSSRDWGPSSRDMGPSSYGTDLSSHDLGPSSHGSAASSRVGQTPQPTLSRVTTTPRSPIVRARGRQGASVIPRSPPPRPAQPATSRTATSPNSSGTNSTGGGSRMSDARSPGPRMSDARSSGARGTGPRSNDSVRRPRNSFRHAGPAARSPATRRPPAVAKQRSASSTSSATSTSTSTPGAANRSSGWVAAAGRVARDSLDLVSRKTVAPQPGRAGPAMRGRGRGDPTDRTSENSKPAAQGSGRTAGQSVPPAASARCTSAQQPTRTPQTEQLWPEGGSRTPSSGAPLSNKNSHHLTHQQHVLHHDEATPYSSTQAERHNGKAAAKGASANGRGEQAWEKVAGLCDVEVVPHQSSAAVSSSAALEGVHGPEGPADREALRGDSDLSLDDPPVVVEVVSGGSSKLGGSSRLGDMEGHSSFAGSSTWRLSEAMLGPGGAASVVFLQSLEDVVSSLSGSSATSPPPNPTVAVQKHPARCSSVVVKGLVELPPKMPSIQE